MQMYTYWKRSSEVSKVGPASRSKTNRDPLAQRAIGTLRERIARIEGARRTDQADLVSTGCEALDQILPGGGIRRGTLIEWFCDGQGGGAETLALLVASRTIDETGVLVAVDSAGSFYPPAAARLGIALDRLIVVRPKRTDDELWAIDQTLRWPGAATVIAWPKRLDGHTFRRFQLAAERAGSVGFFLREEAARNEPSWADARLLVEPIACWTARTRRLRVRGLHGLPGAGADALELDINEETNRMRPAAELAHHATDRRAAGA